MPTFDQAIAQIAARQHALVSVDQAVEVGGTRAMLRSRARGGRLEQVDLNVFRVAGAPLTWESRVLTAALAAGPGALVSHRAAAAVWGLEGFSRGVPELTVPRGRRFRRTNVRVHESTDLDRCGERIRSGLPVTDPSRTLLDLARFVGDQRLLQAVESARRLRLATWHELVACLVKHARRGRPGVQRLRRVIAANVEREEITDSDFELLVLTLFREHDLPDPALHYELRDHLGLLVAEIDLAYPHLKIAIELDGRIHQSGDVFERDRPRQNRIALEGWIILRFTWATFRDRPEEIVREVLAAIRHRQSAS